MIKIAICDNEQHDIQKTEGLLEEILAERHIWFEIDTYLSSMELCRDMKRAIDYDMIFLDIRMKQMNGLEVAKAIKEAGGNAQLAFITAFDEYSKDGYKVNAVRYLLKNELEQLLPECVEAMLDRLKAKSRVITYKFQEGRRKIVTEQISYVECRTPQLTFNFRENDTPPHHLRAKLDAVERDLSLCGFIRIHKSYLVNARCVKEVKNYSALLETGEKLPIPRMKFHNVKTYFLETIEKL
ncbi:MAG: LytTR family DNA-binding domain-containing protein [Lachnospiraceae bacterium]|jgi:DNA-binding LytR/AlgR family response regulator|nr:LytTR family DNA-binding domain-containing protein [Lachnospiraceae bacterium]